MQRAATKERFRSLQSDKRGFTIIELMVATLVFTVVLMVVTMGIIQFTRTYYRGATNAKTQETARALMDNVSQSLQFGLSTPDMGVNDAGTGLSYFCAGGYKFMYTKGVKYTSASSPSGTNAGVYVVQSSGGCDVPTLPLATDGNQLLNESMRVSQLDVRSLNAGMYSVALTVAYGDNDLFCDRRDDATCADTAAVLSEADIASLGPNLRCRQVSGSEFCAVSSLSTVVKKRII